jgi:hypothetical protein
MLFALSALLMLSWGMEKNLMNVGKNVLSTALRDEPSVASRVEAALEAHEATSEEERHALPPISSRPWSSLTAQCADGSAFIADYQRRLLARPAITLPVGVELACARNDQVARWGVTTGVQVLQESEWRLVPRVAKGAVAEENAAIVSAEASSFFDVLSVSADARHAELIRACTSISFVNRSSFEVELCVLPAVLTAVWHRGLPSVPLPLRLTVKGLPRFAAHVPVTWPQSAITQLQHMPLIEEIMARRRVVAGIHAALPAQYREGGVSPLELLHATAIVRARLLPYERVHFYQGGGIAGSSSYSVMPVLSDLYMHRDPRAEYKLHWLMDQGERGQVLALSPANGTIEGPAIFRGAVPEKLRCRDATCVMNHFGMVFDAEEGESSAAAAAERVPLPSPWSSETLRDFWRSECGDPTCFDEANLARKMESLDKLPSWPPAVTPLGVNAAVTSMVRVMVGHSGRDGASLAKEEVLAIVARLLDAVISSYPTTREEDLAELATIPTVNSLDQLRRSLALRYRSTVKATLAQAAATVAESVRRAAVAAKDEL